MSISKKRITQKDETKTEGERGEEGEEKRGEQGEQGRERERALRSFGDAVERGHPFQTLAEWPRGRAER